MNYTSQNLCVRVVIPHFFDPGRSADVIGSGFGSRQSDALRRSCSLFQCLQSIYNLRRSLSDTQLLIKSLSVEMLEPSLPLGSILDCINFEVVICVYRDLFLQNILSLFPYVKIFDCSSQISAPNQLGLAARDVLLKSQPVAGLSVYMEDDLIIHDNLFFDKIVSFYDAIGHKYVLMPHRYEVDQRIHNNSRLYIDGPIDQIAYSSWHHPQLNHAEWRIQPSAEYSVGLDIPENPHAGFFAVSALQVAKLRNNIHQWPHNEFISPLETAATYSVGKFFKILKVSLLHRSIFCIEHGYPSFLGYLDLC